MPAVYVRITVLGITWIKFTKNLSNIIIKNEVTRDRIYLQTYLNRIKV